MAGARLAILMLFLGVVSVCGAVPPSLKPASAPPSVRPKSAPRAGVIFLIGGIGGWDVMPTSARLTFQAAGVPHEVRDFIWTHGWGKLFRDLQDFRHMERKAEELAHEIRQVHETEPERPIFLLAKSGGTGLALRAAELLPEKTIERIVLLAAAVSPDYDLSRALRATRGQIVSFYSPLDQFILNWGTRNFGTIDRHYGPGAGLHGFRRPHDLSPENRALYDRLVQVPWTPRFMWEGYYGGHAANSFPVFLAAEVVPWLK